jgi:hypothetical protein
MKMRDDHNEAICRALKTALAESGKCESDLARAVEPLMSKAAVYRAINAEHPMTVEKAEILVHGVRHLISLDLAGVFNALDQAPHIGSEAVTELMTADCLRIDNDELQDLVRLLADAASRSQNLWIFGTSLPLFLLDEELADRLLEQQVRRIAADPDEALPRLREEIQRRREEFMTFTGYFGLKSIHVVQPLTCFARMLRCTTPFSTEWIDDIDESFDSLIHDAILEQSRGVSLSVLDDLHDGPGRRWVWQHDDFSSVYLFDVGVVMKQRRGAPAVRVLRAETSSIAESIAVDVRSSFHVAETLACHGRGASEVAEFLRGLAQTIRRPGRRFGDDRRGDLN